MIQQGNLPDPGESVTVLNFYNGSNQIIFQCFAQGRQQPFDFVVQGGFTNIVVAANVGTVTTSVNHGLQVGNKVVIGGSATAALNGTYVIATVSSATTFTIATSGVGNATYTDPKSMATTAPRSSAPVWAIKAFTYSGNNLTLIQWAQGNPGNNNIADNRATLVYQ